MKRLFLLMSMIACLCLSAVCEPVTVSATTTSSQEYTITEEEYASYAETLLSQIVAMDDASVDSLVMSGSVIEGLSVGLTSWKDMNDELGAFVEIIKTDVTIDETVTVVVKAAFENREGTYTIEMSADGAEVYSSGFEKVLTIGEIFKRAALNTIIGMGTVFAVLIFIAFIISLFKYIPQIQTMFAKKSAGNEAAPAVVEIPEAEEEELVDDGELVAVIMAAIYASMAAEGKSVSKDKLIVRSIRRSRR